MCVPQAGSEASQSTQSRVMMDQQPGMNKNIKKPPQVDFV